jgi:hypothetical protein
LPSKTPAAWLSYLERKLTAQQKEIKLYEQYYEGEHRLAFATLKFRQSFGYLFRALADNWCEIVVDAPVERLFVEGFRFGSDKPADTGAWDIWQANGLDSESVMAHTEAVKDGRSYILVAPAEPGDQYPQITVEHASQVVVEHAPGNRRRRQAALKKWRDDDGYEYANLYLPDRIFKYRTKTPSKVPPIDGVGRNWTPLEGEESGVNPSAPIVPVIPLYNNPTMLGDGRSDLKPAIPLQDAINKELADMLVASEFAAFQQRVITGLEVESDSEGNPTPEMEKLKSGVERMVVLENAEAKVFSLPASDLGNYVKAIELLLQHLAAQTRTPPHYLLGQIVNVSGDALKAAETGLVSKVKRKQVDFSDSWEEAIRLALGLTDSAEPSKPMNAETIWRDPEYRSEGEMVDAALKKRALSVPLEAIWSMIGASPQQVEEWAKKIDLPERVASIEASSELAAAQAPGGEPAVPITTITERSET